MSDGEKTGSDESEITKITENFHTNGLHSTYDSQSMSNKL